MKLNLNNAIFDYRPYPICYIPSFLNKEEYHYRTIFEGHFPSDAAALSVPQEASVACSTAIALEWDEAFKNMNDPSGRAVAKVHDDAY